MSLVSIDQLAQQITLPSYPQRIVSLVPSQTELLFDLGLDEEIVGVTKFCIHPKTKTTTKQIIGGTKNFRFDTIDQLKPDLIIGNKEENYQEGIEKLANKYPVWMSDIITLQDATEMISSISQLVNKKDQGLQLVKDIELKFSQLKQRIHQQKVLYFIWKKPYMVAGPQTFIHEMLTTAGFQNCVQTPRYPTLTPKEIEALNPSLILLSSEPFPFNEKHIEEFKSICPTANIKIVDGEMFSWYGSRLLHTPQYIQDTF